jgi:REP element-mobilizing transposase RayT
MQTLKKCLRRGNRREDIFLDDVDRQDFPKTLAEACQKTAWQVHACCLMRDHYHLVLETPNAGRAQETALRARVKTNAEVEA